jgi:hypothetical protein
MEVSAGNPGRGWTDQRGAMTNFTIAQAVMARSRPQELAARARSTLAGKIELWLAAAFVFLVPVNILRFDAFYFTASDAIALATLAAMVINRSFPVSPMGATTLLWNSGVLIFWSAMLASSLVYGDPTRGVIVSGQYLFAYLLLTYIILARPWNETVLLIKAFVVSTALMCIHGLVAIPILDQRHSSFVSGNGRFLGWVERENECAALIALALPLALWLVASGSARPRWVWICLPLFTAGVALTGSNTGLLGLIFAISMFVVAM